MCFNPAELADLLGELVEAVTHEPEECHKRAARPKSRCAKPSAALLPGPPAQRLGVKLRAKRVSSNSLLGPSTS
jgi:hypothetical protein